MGYLQELLQQLGALSTSNAQLAFQTGALAAQNAQLTAQVVQLTAQIAVLTDTITELREVGPGPRQPDPKAVLAAALNLIKNTMAPPNGVVPHRPQPRLVPR